MKELDGLVAEALEDRWRSLPSLATFAGVRGYDHALGDFSPEGVAERLRVKRRLLDRLGRLRPRPGSEAALDLRALAGSLRAQAAEIEGWRRLEKDPSLAPVLAVRALNILLIRDLPPAYRRDMLRARLAELPRALREAARGIREPDRTFCAVAIGAARAGAEFVRGRLRGVDPRAAEAAAESLEGYAAFVGRSLLPKARRSFPVGRALFELKLRHEHGLALDARELEELGRGQIAATKEELRRLARSIDGASDWRATVAALKRRVPGERALVAAYRAECRRAREFTLRRGLAGLPAGERLRVVPTPRFEWETLPYAALLPPGPWERRRVSEMWVTPVDPAWPARRRRERLAGHCLWSIPVCAVHEAYPGHHLQLVRANLARSVVRRVFTTPVLVEGWALYCERMMEEEGYLRDPRVRLFRLKDKLWRACRVVVDAGLHVRGWTPRRAAEFLVREALLEPENAAAEVNRYCGSPTQPMSYLVGKLEILKLRSAARSAWGAGYSLRRFHDWLLDQGSGPPSWLEPRGKVL